MASPNHPNKNKNIIALFNSRLRMVLIPGLTVENVHSTAVDASNLRITSSRKREGWYSEYVYVYVWMGAFHFSTISENKPHSIYL